MSRRRPRLENEIGVAHCWMRGEHGVEEGIRNEVGGGNQLINQSIFVYFY